MDEPFKQMREFLMVMEDLNPHDTVEQPEPLIESPSTDVTLVQELADVVFKLRAFMESSNDEYALGVETGMQRAADMIENAIRRHTDRQGDELG